MIKWSALGLVLLAASPAFAQVVGRFAAVQGGAVVVRGGSRVPARAGGDVRLGDLIQTSQSGRAKLLFADGSVLNLGDDSRLKITKFLYDPNEGREGFLELLRGAVRAWVTKLRTTKNRFEVQTPTAVAGVRGTDWGIRETRRGAQIVVFGGEVSVRSLSLGLTGECVAREGMTCNVRPGVVPAPAQKTPGSLQGLFRNLTRVASRMDHASVRLASLLGPRLHRQGAFRPRFDKVTPRGRAGGPNNRGGQGGTRLGGELPGTGTFSDTTQPARYIQLQLQTGVRPNY